LENGATAAVITDAFSRGSAGSEELAEAVMAACEQPNRFDFLYRPAFSPQEKNEILATRLYGADGLDIEPKAQRQLNQITELGFSDLPVCIAKTQYSLSHDPHLLGRPRGFRFPIRKVHLASGAGFLYALASDIRTMPGLPTEPAATRIDIDNSGHITGM
jgi:formate--tetrahydrofolate ligase